VIIFGSVCFLSKKITKLKLKKNWNLFKLTGFGLVRFLEKKPIQTDLAWFFRFGLVFFRVIFGLVFSVSGL
jgi:hypothetical protein